MNAQIKLKRLNDFLFAKLDDIKEKIKEVELKGFIDIDDIYLARTLAENEELICQIIDKLNCKD